MVKNIRMECENVYLTALRIDDESIELYRRWYNNQEILSALGIGDSIFEEDDVIRVKNYKYTSNQKRFSIVLKKIEAMIGVCSVTFDDKYVTGEIDIVIDENYRNAGIGREVVARVTKYAFDEVRAHRLEMSVLADNHAAIQCYKRCGYKECGVLHEKIYTNAKYNDVVIMEYLNKNIEI